MHRPAKERENGVWWQRREYERCKNKCMHGGVRIDWVALGLERIKTDGHEALYDSYTDDNDHAKATPIGGR